MSCNNNEYLIGARIKAARNKKKLTQRQLSEIVEISDTVISQYENAKSIPGLTSLAKIARALDTPIDELYFGNKNESFINEAVDEAELIVNCYYELWQHRAVDSYRKYSHPDYYKVGALLAVSHPAEIEDFIDKLNDYANNRESYENPDVYLNQIKRSIANRIRNTQKKK